MDVLTRITEIIEPSLNELGFDIVRLQFHSGTLQLMAERKETGLISVEDCTQISRTVSALMDVHDPIKGAYMLEVSSPGLERPLVRLSDYERFSGSAARVELTMPLNGRKRYKGILRGANGTMVRMECEGDEAVVELPFADIAQGRLEMVLPEKGDKKGDKKPAKTVKKEKAS